jgi:hypothetical protein
MALGGILGGMADLIFGLGMVLFVQLPLLFSLGGVFGTPKHPEEFNSLFGRRLGIRS